MIAYVGVVVPARNEQELIGRCLDAVLAAAGRVGPVPVSTVVVADRCSDRTVSIAAGLGCEVVTPLVPGVGAARRAGVETVAARAGARGVPLDEVWVATTDADSVVPPDWLSGHLATAATGGRLVVGRVVPDPDELDPELLAAWHQRHPVAGTGHVHGANLAFRLDCYQAAGGFADLALHEDHELVSRFRVLGVDARPGPEVMTSARRWGRLRGGFADYLRDLDLTLQHRDHPGVRPRASAE